ncbi:MAG TPA: anhydro-N-acetylmuramic acid kinase [Terriglobales bacterium]|nr:anhydro-N-acetylmuramic acid kinase [Terriglobales bacterium]
MIVAGVMSGTSADGINVALVNINQAGSRAGIAQKSSLKLLGHSEFPYPKQVRAAVLAAMNAKHAAVADLARLNVLLGELYADALLKTQRQHGIKAELIGCHGQTLYHQDQPSSFLGTKVAATWQTGEAAIIAARVGVPVVNDFRPADMAAGGNGAPLVPFLDYLLYSDRKIGRIVQNIGGIANLTAIPAAASANQVIAFDTGPGNMVIDGAMEHLYGRQFDRDGRTAATGKVLDEVVAESLKRPFFSRKAPKTAGREEFGREFLSEFLRRCRSAHKQDVIATATALTTRSIANAIRRFVLPCSGSFSEVIVSGGGSRNSTLLTMLACELSKLDLTVRSSDEFGLPAEAKEAVAFAVLAFETWHRRPSNIPAATGAKRPAILGKISYA